MSWQQKDNTIQKTFKGNSFNDIIRKLQQLIVVTDRMDHHPDFRVYGYKNIEFTLTTHSEGKVTEKDEELAKEIDRIF